jgi:hypothetical protein
MQGAIASNKSIPNGHFSCDQERKKLLEGDPRRIQFLPESRMKPNQAPLPLPRQINFAALD